MSALSKALSDANVEGWSAAEIARRSGGRIHRATVADVLRGKHAKQPSDEVLGAFCVVFPKLTLQKLRVLAGAPAGEAEPYKPPPEADRLDVRQRRAVDELIRLLAESAQAVPSEPEHDPVEPTVEGVLAAQAKQAGNVRKLQVDHIWPTATIVGLDSLPVFISHGGGKTETQLAQALGRHLRTPLEAVSGLSELLIEDRMEIPDYVEAIESIRGMVAGTPEQALASRPGTKRRNITDRAQDAAGEHDQDLGGMDPS